MSDKNRKVAIENVNVPGKTSNVDATKYYAMKKVFLKILPKSAPGFTQKEIQEKVVAHLPQDIFPGGATSSWWAKAVQLDLEAKGLVKREMSKPLRWHKS